MLFYFAVIVISFLVGFSMKRGGLCTYAAVTQMVNDRRIERMMVFLGVAAWATFILLPLHWLIPDKIALSTTHYDLGIALIGGAILGLGAYFNRGCFFGTFVALVSGNINYIATLFGLSIGVVVPHFYLASGIPSSIEMSSVSEPHSTAYIWLFGMIVFALFMLFSIKIKEENILKKKTGLHLLNWQSVSAMIVIGLGGTLLYATVSGWNYSDVLTNTTSKFIEKQAMGASSMAILATISMIIGGITAAVMAKEFYVSKVQWYLVLGCFVGGVLMGGASMFIPGGNDGLLLKGIPSLAPHAFVGYFAMLVSMLVLVYFFRNERK
jgi:uncharacterized membrane protein YedE/YeeE